MVPTKRHPACRKKKAYKIGQVTSSYESKLEKEIEAICHNSWCLSVEKSLWITASRHQGELCTIAVLPMSTHHNPSTLGDSIKNPPTRLFISVTGKAMNNIQIFTG